MQKCFTDRCLAIAVAALIAPLSAHAVTPPPPSVPITKGIAEPICGNSDATGWRNKQVVDGVEIQESNQCNPDDPEIVAAVVKGTNNVSMSTLMDINLAPDAVIKTDDVDGDGDPDHIVIKLEVVELNGHSPDFPGVVPTFDIAPGIEPGMWVFAPKTVGMATTSFASVMANPLLRLPSPVIRVEQGDTVEIVLHNTHYFPHTIHLHGVDHPYLDQEGNGNDGVEHTGENVLMPGDIRTYEIKPRQTGTMFYHCHVLTHAHLAMGLAGMFIVEENRPNNWVQTLNIGAGEVRHPSVAVKEKYDQEYDLHYHAIDKELHSIIQKYNDVRLIARDMNQLYDITDSTEDYFVLNGRSFPYTLRESLIVVEPDQKIKLRMLNSGGEIGAIHTHGHKATITHYDGIEVSPVAQITRDVYEMTPAQRIDLELNTTNDGLHNYGPGIWVFHDHREKGITNDGIGLGGNVSMIVYKSFLGDDKVPKVQGMPLEMFFSSKFYEGKVPVWGGMDKVDTFGSVLPDQQSRQEALKAQLDTAKAAYREAKAQMVANADTGGGSSFGNFIKGLVLGMLIYMLYQQRQRVLALTRQTLGLIGNSKEVK